MTRGELQSNPMFTKVAVSRARGYVSRKADINNLPAYQYKGKYGEGFTVLYPAWDSTTYCFKEYYIKKEEKTV